MSKTKKKAADEKKTKEEKFTLVELVQSSDVHYPSLIMDLHRAGLLEQYEQELLTHVNVKVKTYQIIILFIISCY